MPEEAPNADLAWQVLNCTKDGICVLGSDLRVLLWNPSLAEVAGVPASEALGRTLTELFPELASGAFLSMWERSRNGEVVSVVPWQYEIRQSGQKGYARLELSPLKAPVGGVMVAFRDITPMAESRRRLKASHVLLEAILQSAPIGIVALDRHRHVTFWNRGAERMFGWKEEEIRLGPALWVPEEMQAEHRMLFQSAARRDAPIVAEVVRRRKDGSAVDASVSVQAVRNEAGDVTGYTAIFQDISQRKRFERELLRSESRLARAQRIAMMGTYEARFSNWPPDETGSSFWSPGVYEILGLDPRTVEPSVQALLSAVPEDDRTRMLGALGSPTPGDSTRGTFEYRVLEPGGKARVVRHHVEITREQDGGILLIGAVQDITEHRRLEEQLLQSQKLEGIGQLAGGVAHDFNNLLTIINGYADLLVRDAALSEPSREIAGTILSAGQRAAELTQQLLAFSRRQILHPRAVHLNQVFLDLRKMLDRLLGADIEVVERLDPQLAPVFADAGQLQQVMLNIIVNARDAMPGGGRLTVETSNVLIDDSYTGEHPEAVAGPYVCLAISDSGIGMDEETRLRVFEPFFTTKQTGRGTGLGLASVYGIVRQSRGFVWVYSALGRGTTLKVYLPCTKSESRSFSEPPTPGGPPVKVYSILLVEDQEPVRLFVARVLRAHGHRVLEAPDGAAALAMEQTESGLIHLLLTDVVLPGMTARAVAETVRARRPDTRVLFISGYSESVILHNGILDPGADLLIKPFSPQELLARVERALADNNG